MKKILVIIMSLVLVQLAGAIRHISNYTGPASEYMQDVRTFHIRLLKNYLSRFPSDSIYALDIPINQEFVKINDTLLIFRSSDSLVKSFNSFNTLKELKQKWSGFEVEYYYDEVPHVTLLYDSCNYLAYWGSNQFDLGAAITINDKIDFGGINVGDSIEDLAEILDLHHAIPDDVSEIMLAGNLIENKWKKDRTSIDKSEYFAFFYMRFTINDGHIVRICHYCDCMRNYPLDLPMIHIPTLDGKEIEFVPETIPFYVVNKPCPIKHAPIPSQTA